ncbi:MAG: glycosyltransferase family 4 protein [Paracoccaceae bacterium]
MARALQSALLSVGCSVDLASELRSLDSIGDPNRQIDLQAEADLEVKHLLDHGTPKKWQAWVTYHNYYKAPDLIGPTVSAMLGIPYIQIESTRARKRLQGPWRSFAQAAEAASDHADVIFHLTVHDRETLEERRSGAQKIVHLLPFLARSHLDPVPERKIKRSKILCAGMMRPGDKLASYQIAAQTLSQLSAADWQLEIAGDGLARPAVETLFAPIADRVTFSGELEPTAMSKAYESADLFFWPGVNEAFGMVYLEAQAAGLPIIAQDRPGVRDVVHGGIMTDPSDPIALTNSIDRLLQNPNQRQRLGQIGRDAVRMNHLIPAAAHTLMTQIQPLIGAAQ